MHGHSWGLLIITCRIGSCIVHTGNNPNNCGRRTGLTGILHPLCNLQASTTKYTKKILPRYLLCKCQASLTQYYDSISYRTLVPKFGNVQPCQRQPLQAPLNVQPSKCQRQNWKSDTLSKRLNSLSRLHPRGRTGACPNLAKDPENFSTNR